MQGSKHTGKYLMALRIPQPPYNLVGSLDFKPFNDLCASRHQHLIHISRRDPDRRQARGQNPLVPPFWAPASW